MVDKEHKLALINMFDNVIKNKSDESKIDFHGYLQDKMQSIFMKDDSTEDKKDTDEE